MSPVRQNGPNNQTALGSDGASPRGKINDRHDQRDHQQNMDKAACNVKSPPQQPEDQQYSKNSPQHGSTPEARGPLLSSEATYRWRVVLQLWSGPVPAPSSVVTPVLGLSAASATCHL